MSERRLVIAGTNSGVGKTTLTIGIMAALKQKGYVVQGFKCGPDYIDPSYHTAVTGRQSRNLDSWMLEEDVLKDVFIRGSARADISIIEGVMGFYDGKSATSNQGSTAEISSLTQSPVILVVNVESMARSAAAIVKGFQLLDESVNIVGVIANKVGSEGHYQLVKQAVEQMCHIPVIGYLTNEQHLEMPERHLGLIPSVERGELDSFFETLAQSVASTIDLDLLCELAETTHLNAPAHSIFTTQAEKKPKDNSPESKAGNSLEKIPDNRPIAGSNKSPENGLSANIKLAVAKDKAFNFYYVENIELLQSEGAEIVYFSPLAGEQLPNDVDGLYIGGGFPEEFAKELSEQNQVKLSIKQAIENGMPTLAECGGYMYLTEAIETTDGKRYEMVGIIPAEIAMQKRLAAIGYREVTGEPGNFLLPEGYRAKGHEFHYSVLKKMHTCNSGTDNSDKPPDTSPDKNSSKSPSHSTGKDTFSQLSPSETPAYETKGLFGIQKEGFMGYNLVAGYTHLHFGSCPQLAKHWVQRCYEYKQKGATVTFERGASENEQKQ